MEKGISEKLSTADAKEESMVVRLINREKERQEGLRQYLKSFLVRTVRIAA